MTNLMPLLLTLAALLPGHLPPRLCRLWLLLHPIGWRSEPRCPRAKARQQLPAGVQRLWVLLRQQSREPTPGAASGGDNLPPGLHALGELLPGDGSGRAVR